MKKIILLCLIISITILKAEESSYKSAHQIVIDEFNNFKYKSEKKTNIYSNKNVSCEVLGFLPYWINDSYIQNFDFSSLTMLAYFSYELNPETGSYNNLHGFDTKDLSQICHQNDCKLLLTVTQFSSSGHKSFLRNDNAIQTNIDSLIVILNRNNADGVVIDFEGLPSGYDDEYKAYLSKLSNSLKQWRNDALLVICTPAVDWRGYYENDDYSSFCDYFFIMAYDYHWSSSPTAGPVAPLHCENYNVARTINTYLNSGFPDDKIIVGLPWYGFDWPVINSERGAETTASAKAYSYASMIEREKNYPKLFDNICETSWMNYAENNKFRQTWYDDSLSFRRKVEYSALNNVAGIGIWALGYEGNNKALWNVLNEVYKYNSVIENTFSEIKVYPNPAKEKIFINFLNNYSTNELINIEIYDLSGKLIIKKNILCSEFYNIVEVNTQKISGLYYLTIKKGSLLINNSLILINN